MRQSNGRFICRKSHARTVITSPPSPAARANVAARRTVILPALFVSTNHGRMPVFSTVKWQHATFEWSLVFLFLFTSPRHHNFVIYLSKYSFNDVTLFWVGLILILDENYVLVNDVVFGNITLWDASFKSYRVCSFRPPCHVINRTRCVLPRSPR